MVTDLKSGSREALSAIRSYFEKELGLTDDKKKNRCRLETKGGFDTMGNSEDIDIYSPKKFKVLKDYLKTHKLKGGFVRFDARSDELCICTENYSDDITSTNWKILNEVFICE